jgi:hypothetical protein
MGAELFMNKQPRGKDTSLIPLVAHELRRDGKLRLFQQVTSLGARSNAHWYCTSGVLCGDQ